MKSNELVFINDAIETAFSKLPNYTYQEILYTILRGLEIKNINELLYDKKTTVNLYESVYKSVRDEIEEDFTHQELEQIKNNIQRFNNSSKWERSRQKI